MIGIIDYGLGNLNSFYNIYKEKGINLKLIKNYKEINKSINKIILPGVGSFDKAISLLKKQYLFNAILEFSENKNNKILGVCVGMQILASASDEGELTGLSFIDQNFQKIKNSVTPHIGWNNVALKKNHYLFRGIENESFFYFLHSYCMYKIDTKYIVAETNYAHNFISVFQKENVMGVQFHPEKSHSQGQKLLLNFYNN